MQYIISFLEGIITFISPCLLPMIPVYISYFAGSSESNSRKVMKNAAGFIAGFTIVFILMGALAGSFGSLLSAHRTGVNIITGLIVIFFGMNFLGIFNLNIFRGFGFSKSQKAGFFSSVLFGIVFSIGWTPCVGAFLGSALMLAANRASAAEGIGMLFAYSLGLAIPFFISAVLIDRLKNVFSFVQKKYDIINSVCGVFLIIIGILMASGLFGKFLLLLS